MIVAGTGHRYITEDKQLASQVRTWTRTWLEHYMPSQVITGMAVGFDMILAHEAIKLDIPVVAAIPFEGHGQSQHWPGKYRQAYQTILKLAERVELVSPGEYEKWKYLKRDEWMVDNCNELIACWNGGKKGGTYHTVAYAIHHDRPIHFIPFMLLTKRK